VEPGSGDVLVGAPERSAGPSRVVVGVLLAALLLAVGGDRWQAARERAALLDAVVGGEQVVQGSAASLRGLRTYVGPLVSNLDARPAARQWAFDAIRADAARWRPRVRDERAGVLAVPVAPWHRDARAARAAYAGRLAAWDDLLGGVGRRGGGSGAPARSAAERASEALVLADLDEERVRELLGLGEARSTTRR
jgi:hypothetical protein